jgi:hypothetical protein
VQPLLERVVLSKETPSGATLPTALEDAAFGTLKIAGKPVAVVVGKGKADAARADTLWVDANCDGKWTDDERFALEVSEAGGRPVERSAAVDFTFTIGTNKLQAKATCMRVKEELALNVLFPAFLEATFKIGDEDRVVAVLDKDLDGAFDGKDDLWALGKPGGNPVQAIALSLLGEKRFLDGQLVGIAIEKNNLVKVTAAAASGPDPKDSAALRVRAEKTWFERFDKEREGFVEQRKLDTRARAPRRRSSGTTCRSTTRSRSARRRTSRCSST